uniref:CAP_C domain-containing protein n=1 Tax=Macrostomum lignano TaxID=282301 RepID=A0A1I8F5P3_9PLAT
PGRAEVDCADCGDGVCLWVSVHGIGRPAARPGSYLGFSSARPRAPRPGQPLDVTVAAARSRTSAATGCLDPSLKPKAQACVGAVLASATSSRVQARGAGALEWQQSRAQQGTDRVQRSPRRRLVRHRVDGASARALRGVRHSGLMVGTRQGIPLGDWEANGGGSRRAELVANSVVVARRGRQGSRSPVKAFIAARVGQRASFLVATADAPSGALAVTIDGPSKVQLNCREMVDGYEFFYTPTTPGHYLVGIRVRRRVPHS